MTTKRRKRTGPPARTARRFGLRSLSGRMVVMVLLPLLLAQYLVFRDLGRLRSAADDATELVDRIGLMGEVGSIYAPAAFEEMTSLGLATVDRLGIDRSLVAGALGFDYDPYLERSRVDLDRALDALASDYGPMMLASGETVADRLTAVRAELGHQRERLDQLVATRTDIALALAGVISLADELVATSEAGLRTTDNVDVVVVGDEASHLSAMIQAVATETRANAAGLGGTNQMTGPGDALIAAGIAQYAIARYSEVVDHQPVERAAWHAFAASRPLQDYAAVRPQISVALSARAQIEAAPSTTVDTSTLVTDPEFIRSVADILQRAFDRLEAFEAFGTTQFEHLTDRAATIGDRADRDVRNWFWLLVTLTLVSLFFLALTMWTTVRPLRRLTSRALDVGRGEIPTEPLKVNGPSDVRAVTTTFNSMLATLSSFEAHLGRLASGEGLTDREVTVIPGSLGESLRASVRHLSHVTTLLRESEALATAIVDTATDAIWTVDRRGIVLSANAAADRLLGIRAERQVGASLPDLFGGRAEVTQLEGELDFRRPDNTAGHVLISQSEVLVDGRMIHTVFARDISERKRFEERLAYQARTDMLTGLPNRLAAIEHLEAVLSRVEQTGRPVGVLFIDLDGFKAVNDGRGHANGDQLLRDVGRRLRSELRESEFVGRLGGDEFLVVAEGLRVAELVRLGERLVVSVSQPFEYDDDCFVISASAGAAVASAGVDGLELIRRADVAVYNAKSNGRGRVVPFDSALQEEVEANAEIELALRRAIADDELVLHFQPIVDLRTGQAWGCEALVRWDRPGYGQLMPDRFIPVAERSGLIIDLERWVATSALRTLAEWQHDPRRAHLHMAINISGRHLMEGDLVEDLRGAFLATGANPASLEVELTETHLLADLDRANFVLRSLRNWGVDVAVDDFGTGYSSMSYLRQLEIDTIKIDRVFVARAQQPGYDRTIVEVLLQLASSLGLDVVAEGVETTEQLDFLQDRNCSRVQGFHIARPMPLQQTNEWLTIWDLADAAVA